MGRRKRIDLSSVSTARIRWLQQALREVRADLRGARESKTWSAVAALHRQAQQVRGELDAERLRAAETSSVERDAADLSADEWAAAVDADSRAASDDDLELYVSEWLRRHGLLLEVEAGEMRIVRRSVDGMQSG